MRRGVYGIAGPARRGGGFVIPLGAVKSVSPGTRKGIHVKHKVVPREPWKGLLRDAAR